MPDLCLGMTVTLLRRKETNKSINIVMWLRFTCIKYNHVWSMLKNLDLFKSFQFGRNFFPVSAENSL